ncbi:hypothetical protein AALO_G00179680 [Alosa alosa]|uniref:CSD domain-containing protein n=1 Tax=Alosa alosa TaxID=278164 RepID=A0AAV6GDJ6_9TELE|nr:hypothetical protein AALO_G00179680 [Alosa alosa]
MPSVPHMRVPTSQRATAVGREQDTVSQEFISDEMGSVSTQDFSGGCTKTEEDEGPSTEEDSQSYHGLGVCKWFNVRMGFGFLSMTNREGAPLESPVDVFVHQVSNEFTDSDLSEFL